MFTAFQVVANVYSVIDLCIESIDLCTVRIDLSMEELGALASHRESQTKTQGSDSRSLSAQTLVSIVVRLGGSVMF